MSTCAVIKSIMIVILNIEIEYTFFALMCIISSPSVGLLLFIGKSF